MRIGYLEAAHAERVLSTFRELAGRYWNSQRDDAERGAQMAGGVTGEDAQHSPQLRSTLAEMIGEATDAADRVGAPSSITYAPPAMVGGPVLTLNVFEQAIDDYDRGIKRIYILDCLNRAVGTAERAKHRALMRLCPWYWVIDIPALALRVPFLILRRAGLPASIEENVGAYIIKVAILVVAAVYLTARGIDVTLTDLVSVFTK